MYIQYYIHNIEIERMDRVMSFLSEYCKLCIAIPITTNHLYRIFPIRLVLRRYMSRYIETFLISKMLMSSDVSALHL